MNKISQFFKITKYEIFRVFSNKAVFSLLILFPILLMLVLSFITQTDTRYPIAIYTDGQDIEQVKVVELIKENIAIGDIIYVEDNQQGIDLVNNASACFFISLQQGIGTDQTTATFYYDQSNTVASSIVGGLMQAKNQYAYDTLTEFLSNYGITINETYFQAIDFKATNAATIDIHQLSYSAEMVVCIALILMLGLAYSVSRDNETQVSKNIAYIPIGKNRYLLSKTIPYMILGFAEIFVGFVIGSLLFKIDFQTSIAVMLPLTFICSLSILSLGLLFSLLKSQIATILLDMLAVLIPLFISLIVYAQALPIPFQIILDLLPFYPMITFLNCMIYNGVIIWAYIPLFIAQAVVYYIISLFIIKRRIRD